MSQITYKNVGIYQQESIVLENVDFKIGSREFVYLIGNVGSGKSSLLKTMYGELDIHSGEANVLGYDMAHIRRKQIPALRKRIGIVFQDFQLLTDRNVRDNLDFVLKAIGISNKKERAHRIEEVLLQVEMETKGYKMPHELSGGEQQRIVIARAILNNPDIILADEPTGNLDKKTGTQIVKLLHEISKKEATVIMTTHNLQLIEEFPGRILVCDNHHIKEVFSIPSEEYGSDIEGESAEGNNLVSKIEETEKTKEPTDTAIHQEKSIEPDSDSQATSLPSSTSPIPEEPRENHEDANAQSQEQELPTSETSGAEKKDATSPEEATTSTETATVNDQYRYTYN
ncbi:MAG: ATP-binding cassette domain-containing protein [Bacteroidales bacterium]|nr:ATP-binding cassette domain-containing protein [Bacteroidales bacterium]